ncbi:MULTISPECIES: structural cement protein Gp24 [Pseudomonas]|uniref:Uncharacterized protein n=1 Tax=Pseudomonas putida S13.1.2 TaxID=1384061 RepID=A0AAU8RS31_PSEPU|nr:MULTISPECIES: DUF2190 family protein [Pseudomonas]AJQ46429.1 hypothetical protein N805_04005 [Pseudomonas putida S13.1.2]
MPAIQTNYTANIPAKKLGHIPDMTQADLISRTVETVAGIGFGLPVAQGADDKGCILFAGSGFIGVTTRDRSVLAGEQYARYESARILKKGPITVTASVAVVAGDPVYLTPAGAFTNVSTSNVAIPNSRFDTSASAGALANIFIK